MKVRSRPIGRIRSMCTVRRVLGMNCIADGMAERLKDPQPTSLPGDCVHVRAAGIVYLMPVGGTDPSKLKDLVVENERCIAFKCCLPRGCTARSRESFCSL